MGAQAQMLDRLSTRVLALLGLDLDFSVSMARAPFNAITDDVFLGARPERSRVAALREAGVTHVVSCLAEGERERVAFLEDHFETHFIPLHDGVREDVGSVFPSFFELVRSAREQHPRSKVLVHCEVGVSRSATLVTALLMERGRKRFFDAYCDVRSKRGEVLPNIGFASQLQRLEHELMPEARQMEGVSSLARYLREVCTVPIEVETLETVLADHDYDAVDAIRAIFGDEIPRVVQGVRL